MQDIMHDLETLGTTPGCSILSIGAVAFDARTGELDEENGFYIVVNRQSCLDAGLFEEQETVDWWGRQSEAAQQVLHDAEEGVPLARALVAYGLWASKYGGPSYEEAVRVWGNGADFDNAILAAAWKAVGGVNFWKYGSRCYRTVKNLAPHIKMDKRTGTHHHALDDAKSQAQHLLDIVRQTTFTLA